MAKRAGEASSSGERWPSKILPEHTIFLSHSGDDKPFVERLCEELKRLDFTPFFDQNSDSLPKGERFPPHVFKAAEQCLLAVIVLSEGYLTSKWPMLELAAFVKARETKNPSMKLLPLFYKLPPSDLVPEKWMESWKKLAEDGKIDAKEIELWSQGVEVLMEAKNVESKRLKSLMEHDDDEIIPNDFPKLLAGVVKDLRPFNGLEFNKYGTSEGRFIGVVVDEICEIIPPVMKYSIDGILGYERMCEKASSLFQEGSLPNDVCKPGCFYLGFHGMGVVGKTTLCEAMCSFHQAEFRGRVCHVELQSDSKEDQIKRLKHVVHELGGCDDRVLQGITTISQGLECLQDRLKSQPRAFLAVDNVGDSESSRDEARSFIKSVLACGSKVMVTSRSRTILESVLGEAKYCKPIPRLEEQEAEELFLSVAIPQKLLSPLQPDEVEIVKACVEECKFLDDGYDVHQYHPLVLRALGTFFHDVDKSDIMKWKQYLMFEKKLRKSRESNRVKDILGLNYANLSDGQKLLFLDVVFLFNDEKSLMRSTHLWSPCEDEYQWCISLIAAMHGISTLEADYEVKKLQRKSFIYESTLKTHDLYIEFAQSVVAMEGIKEKEWWVGHRDANGDNLVLKRLLLFEDESKIGHPPKQLWECPNLECLFILREQINVKLKSNVKLDLNCFPNLRVLFVGYFSGIETLRCTNAVGCDLNSYGFVDLSKGCLPELRVVHLCGFHFKRVPFLKQCWNLTFLRIDDFNFEILDFPQDAASLFENLKALQTLILSSSTFCRFPSHVYDGIIHCATKMKNLKCLEIN